VLSSPQQSEFEPVPALNQEPPTATQAVELESPPYHVLELQYALLGAPGADTLSLA